MGYSDPLHTSSRLRKYTLVKEDRNCQDTPVGAKRQSTKHKPLSVYRRSYTSTYSAPPWRGSVCPRRGTGRMCCRTPGRTRSSPLGQQWSPSWRLCLWKWEQRLGVKFYFQKVERKSNNWHFQFPRKQSFILLNACHDLVYPQTP